MASRSSGIGRREFLRRSAAWVAATLPAAAALRAQDGSGGPEKAVEIPFESEPGAQFAIVQSLVSTFGKTPSDTELVWERGGMFRRELTAKVLRRDEAGVATVQVDGTRGNGAIWVHGSRLVLFDSTDPKGTTATRSEHADDGRNLVDTARNPIGVKLSPRGEVVAVYAWYLKPPAWVGPRESHVSSEGHRLFLPLPPGPLRPGDAHRAWITQDDDPINSGMYENQVPLDLGIRFEGATADIARFSIRGGAEPDPSGEAYSRAVRRVMKWIDRVDVEGVVDVDLATGWVRSRDQTTRVSYRWIERRKDRSGAVDVVRVVNRRHLIVTGTRVG